MKEYLDKCEKDGTIATDVDGFYYWVDSEGYIWSAHALRAIADRLDEKNKGWEECIDDFFNGQLTFDFNP